MRMPDSKTVQLLKLGFESSAYWLQQLANRNA